MKKIIILIGMLSFPILFACNNSNTEENRELPPNANPAPSPIPPAAAPKEQKQQDGTTIKMDENGVSYESKSGEKKSSVSLSGDSTKVEIRK